MNDITIPRRPFFRRAITQLGKLMFGIAMLILGLLLLAVLVPPARVPSIQGFIAEGWWLFTAIRVVIFTLIARVVWPWALARKQRHWQSEYDYCIDAIEACDTSDEDPFNHLVQYGNWCSNRMGYWKEISKINGAMVLIGLLSIEAIFAQLPFLLMIW